MTVAVLSSHGRGCDVLVTADGPTPLAAVRPHLVALLGEPTLATAPAWCNGVRVDDAAVGLPPLLQAAVLVFGEQPGPRHHVVPCGLLLGVSRGPDAGRLLALPPGRSVIGRGPDADLRLCDPEVSRSHASLTVRNDGVSLADLGSTNGTRVRAAGDHGEPAPTDHIAPAPRDVPDEARITLGGTELVLRRADALEPASTTPDGQGHVLLSRTGRLHSPPPSVHLTYPAPATVQAASPPAWLLLLLPVLVAVPLAIAWHQPAFLVLALASPVAALGQYLLERRQSRRRRRRSTAEHERARAQVHAKAGRALAEQRRRADAEHPDLAQLLLAASVPTTSVWQRRRDDADALVVRVGRGVITSGVVVVEASTGEPAAALDLPDAPVTLDLRHDPVLGICGPRPAALALARAIVGQLAVLCSPHDLSIDVVTTAQARGDWRWARWLPHAAAPAGVGAPEERHRLVVLDGAAALRRRTDVLALLTSPGTACLCLGPARADLPSECTAVVATRADDRLDLHRAHAQTVADVAAEHAGPVWAEAVARALAPLRDATPSTTDALPATVDLLSAIRAGSPAHAVPGVDPMSADGLAGLWALHGRCSSALLGARVDGQPWVVDLVADGPHVLVAGTTGAGKSALLRSWVLALAAVNRPDELTFVLVDYKGGAAFAGCADLPHVSGVVTDLDDASTRRALRSLQAELRRRERLLKDAAVSDAQEYADKAACAPLPRLARLVIVVDEFAVLSEELPDFVSGLVRIAAVGRSLGVHLILATQRPAGVVSADIRANMSLRLALRVREQIDSLDVVDAPDASRLPPSRPGRAVVRGGDGDLVHVQVAHLGATGTDRGSPVAGHVRVQLADAPEQEEHVRGQVLRKPAKGASDPLHVIAAAMSQAARRLQITVPPPPWLPPLPASLDWSALTQERPDHAAEVRIGLVDLPDRQARQPWCWRLDEGGNLAAIGGPRTGRTTTARAIALACASTAHVYVIDASGALADLEQWPHVGAVVACQDLERSMRLLELLAGEVRRRRARAASTPRQTTGPSGSSDDPVVLIVDGWEAVCEAWALTRLPDRLLALLRDGPAAGVLAAVTGGRTVLTAGVSAQVTTRLLLRFADPVEAALAGVRPRDIPTDQPPGRALHVTADGVHHVQIALPPPLMAVGGAPPTRRPTPVPALPSLVLRREVDRMPAEEQAPADADVVGMGIGTVGIGTVGIGTVGIGVVATDRLAPVAIDLRPPGLLVVGGPGSGRTRTLMAVSAAVREGGRLAVHIGPQDDAGRVGALLAAAPSAVAIVDDATCIRADVDDVLARHAGAHLDGAVVAACAPAEAATSFRGVLAMLKQARRAVVLGPLAPAELDWLGTRPPVPAACLPGRGWLLDRGRLTAMQVALTAEAPRPDPQHTD